MTIVTSGLDWKGDPCEFTLNVKLHKELQEVKKVVNTKDFDYVAMVCGLPGQGRFDQALCLYRFDQRDHAL